MKKPEMPVEAIAVYESTAMESKKVEKSFVALPLSEESVERFYRLFPEIPKNCENDDKIRDIRIIVKDWS